MFKKKHLDFNKFQGRMYQLLQCWGGEVFGLNWVDCREKKGGCVLGSNGERVWLKRDTFLCQDLPRQNLYSPSLEQYYDERC